MSIESLLSMRGECYVFACKKIHTHYEYFSYDGYLDVMILEDIHTGIEDERIDSKRTYIDDKK